MELLLSPHRVGALQLRNRIVLPPITTLLSDLDGRVSPREIAFLAARARGGAGLVIAGPFLASTALEESWGLLRIDEDGFVPGVTRLVGALHDAGAAAGAQLTIGMGRMAPAGAVEPVSASAVRTPGGRLCRPVSEAEIELLVGEVGRAARRLADAGMDLIDIDARAGGLVDQFLTPLWNTRDDAWGGGTERRAALLVALVAAVRGGAPVGR